MKLDKDHLTLWVISGVVAVLSRDLYSLAVFLMHWVKLPVWTIAADIFIDKPQFFTFLGILIGIVADICIGALLAIFIGIGIDWQDGKHYWLIGLGVGIAAWLFFYGAVLHNLPQTMKNAPQDALTSFLSFIGHELYGWLTAWIYIKLLRVREAKS